MIKLVAVISVVFLTMGAFAQNSGYVKNLEDACDLFVAGSDLHDSILLGLVPDSYEEFELLYGTTAPDNRMEETGFFYSVTKQIFDKLMIEKKEGFYLPCLQLGSFADGEFGEAFIERLDIIIPRDKDRFCNSGLDQEYLNRNPLQFYYEKYCK